MAGIAAAAVTSAGRALDARAMARSAGPAWADRVVTPVAASRVADGPAAAGPVAVVTPAVVAVTAVADMAAVDMAAVAATGTAERR
jgi:hypothetical protein